jgi:hypothetical protein
MADLTDLAAVKVWLAIATSGSDAILTSLVTSTSADFLRAIARSDFEAADYTEVREGDGGSRLVMRHWPINTIASITVAGVALDVSPDKVAGGYYFDDGLDPERLNEIYLAGGDSFADAAAVVVAYNAGYADVPEDVAQAVIEWVAARYKGRPGATLNSQREAGGEHVTYDREAPMPPTTAAVVERYKRCWPSLDKRNDDRNYRVTRINRTITTTIKEGS